MHLRDRIARESREQMRVRQAEAAQDPQRPRYHYQPYPSWMNDPVPFFWEGKYHIFHQHSPEGKPYHYELNWAHIISDDLVHWDSLPPLAPPEWGPDNETWDRYRAAGIHGGPDDSLYEMLNKPECLHLNKRGAGDDDPKPVRPDSYGLWSGSVIEHEGVFYAFYTGGSAKGTCLATSKDLVTWEREIDNRVIKGWRTFGERDACVWREGDVWYLMVSTLDVYESRDLYHWKFVGKLEGECEEFPDFFGLGGRQVLITHLGPNLMRKGDWRGKLSLYARSQPSTPLPQRALDASFVGFPHAPQHRVLRRLCATCSANVLHRRVIPVGLSVVERSPPFGPALSGTTRLLYVKRPFLWQCPKLCQPARIVQRNQDPLIGPRGIDQSWFYLSW